MAITQVIQIDALNLNLSNLATVLVVKKIQDPNANLVSLSTVDELFKFQLTTEDLKELVRRIDLQVN